MQAASSRVWPAKHALAGGGRGQWAPKLAPARRAARLGASLDGAVAGGAPGLLRQRPERAASGHGMRVRPKWQSRTLKRLYRLHALRLQVLGQPL